MTPKPIYHSVTAAALQTGDHKWRSFLEGHWKKWFLKLLSWTGKKKRIESVGQRPGDGFRRGYLLFLSRFLGIMDFMRKEVKLLFDVLKKSKKLGLWDWEYEGGKQGWQLHSPVQIYLWGSRCLSWCQASDQPSEPPRKKWNAIIDGEVVFRRVSASEVLRLSLKIASLRLRMSTDRMLMGPSVTAVAIRVPP